jgi:hypothetical protein
MVLTKDNPIDTTINTAADEADSRAGRILGIKKILHRHTYYGSLLSKPGAFVLPALYGTPE